MLLGQHKQVGELFRERAPQRHGRQIQEGRAVGGQRRGIDRVGLRQQAEHPGETARAQRIGEHHSDPPGMQRLVHREVVAPRGLDDHAAWPDGPQATCPAPGNRRAGW